MADILVDEYVRSDNPLFKADDDLDWLEFDEIPQNINNPLMNYSYGDIEPTEELVKYLIDPDYLHFAARILLNVELAPYQLVVLDMLWRRRSPMLLGTRGAAKSFILGVYCLLRMTLEPGCKIVIVGAGLRQSRQVFDYMATIWDNSPILRDIAGKGKTAGPRREVDRFQFEIGNSICCAVPLGDGSKIRGLRANYIIADEFGSINPDIFNIVVRGFATVEKDPITNVKERARIKKLKKMGLWTPEMDTNKKKEKSKNQIVYSGTPTYHFNHFYKHYKQWENIIKSKGDPKKLEELFGGDKELQEAFDWTDYAVMRMPYNYLPEGMLATHIIADAKANLPRNQFLLEYCFEGNQEILTNRGVKKIKDIVKGDEVLTHNGRFKKVIRTFSKKYNGKLINITGNGSTNAINVTPNHEFYMGNDNWQRSDQFKCHDMMTLANLQDLYNIDYVNISDYTSKYSITTIDNKQYIRAKASRDTGNKVYNRLYKNSIPNAIKLNYDLGIIFGYYASEGSIGANGRSVEFSLDGHKDKTLLSYVEELNKAIINVFGKAPVIFDRKNQNTTKLFIHSRIIVDFLKNNCPGISHTKVMNPELLFSNKEFMKGFLTGYWHGDGCIFNEKYQTAHCVNKNLLCQIKLILSYFNIGCSINDGKCCSSDTIFRGKKVNCRASFSLSMRGNNAIRFFNFINNTNIDESAINNKIISKIDNTNFYIRKIENSDFDGLVYNLEVEDDHSYSLINSTVHNCACFVADSDGFYKRSIIEAASTNKPILINGKQVQFSIMRQGNPDKSYIIGIDPAADQDNAAIIILELNGDHRRIVQCWTTNKKKYNSLKKKMLERNIEINDDYYAYIARKVRQLMGLFSVEKIVMDKHGGGTAVAEALSSKRNTPEGEFPIYEEIDYENPKPSDSEEGLHILRLIIPSSELNSDANHGMLKDIQEKILLFPLFDTIELARSATMDDINSVDVDTYEDLVYEIEELKNEMTTIVVAQSNTGKETFDTPSIKSEGMRKGHLRKDRFSALLYANYYARNKDKNTDIVVKYTPVGGTRDTVRSSKHRSNTLYYGPGIAQFGNHSWLNGNNVRFSKGKLQ